MCSHIAFSVVGRGAAWKRAHKVSLSCVGLHVVIQAKLDVKPSPACGTLKVFVISAALLLTVLPPSSSCEIFPTMRAERARFHSFRTHDLKKVFWWNVTIKLLTRCDECYHTYNMM